MTAKSKSSSPITVPAKRCLALLLQMELKGQPVEFHSWRAANAKKIPLLDELRRHRAIDGDTHCHVTFWGLMNAPGEAAKTSLANCERVFNTLRKYYPRHPKEPLLLEDLAKRSKLSLSEALQSAHFLSRSPAFLSVHTNDQVTRISPNEQYVTFGGFDAVGEKAREESSRSLTSVLPNLFANVASESPLLQSLLSSESEAVRECWHKAIERISRDPAGAITAARSLSEAACHYVLEELGEPIDTSSDLPKLYKKVVALLQLEQRADVNAALRRVLQACATLVDGLAELRNKLGDAHGKGGQSPKPAKRHAQFIVAISGALTSFLLDTLDAQRAP
jgi:hypothetical protein